MIAAKNNVIVGYFTEWGSNKVEDVDFNKVTHINYSFGKFDEQALMPSVENSALLASVVEAAHKSDCKVLVSLGGWTGSKSFSPVVATAATRTKFATNIKQFIDANKLDGIDIDWEYPGQAGDGNKYDKADTSNFLLFLNELRGLVGKKLITIAVGATVYDGSSDLSGYGKVLDLINIMAYDINFSGSPQSGPNAGLDFEAGKAAQTSVKSSVKAWSSAGIPLNKLVVGLPFYGTISNVKEDLNESTGMYGTRVENTGKPITYAEIMTSALSGSAKANTGAGWVRHFDKVSQTPWLFNAQTKSLISYDDAQSLKAKAKYVLSNGLGGVMIWALNQDYKSELLNSVQIVKKPSKGGKPKPKERSSTEAAIEVEETEISDITPEEIVEPVGPISEDNDSEE
ncbi:glycoside hydrolase [Neoconidiobolus thromboides FSU 785]|nr:glycoside hydrolase [Neoconidiobolus thromboides FSU 785]